MNGIALFEHNMNILDQINLSMRRDKKPHRYDEQNANTLKTFGKQWAQNIELNIQRKEYPPLFSQFGKWMGETVCVIGASPSFNADLAEKIKQSGFKTIVVDRAVPRAAEYGLIPDFVISADSQVNVSWWMRSLSKGCNVALGMIQHKATVKEARRRGAAIHWYLPIEPWIPCVWAAWESRRLPREYFSLYIQGTVGFGAADLAVKMGAKCVILLASEFGWDDYDKIDAGSKTQGLYTGIREDNGKPFWFNPAFFQVHALMGWFPKQYGDRIEFIDGSCGTAMHWKKIPFCEVVKEHDTRNDAVHGTCGCGA